MTREDLQRHIYRNSISNYIFLVVRLAFGLVLYRLIVQSLQPEEFGFWVLLWSVFGYGILLDFGFGFTAQKRVAELSVKRDWDQLSRVLSTIFYIYLGLACVMILFGLAASPLIIQLFKVSELNRPTFTAVLTIFFCGMGVAFPAGIFPEILRGQQRISLANYTLLAGYLLNFVLVLLCLHYHWGLEILITIALGCSIGSDLACGLFALRQIPEVKIRPRFFSRKMVHNTMRFSIFAYITTLTTVILTRTDQVVISMALSVSAVGIYGIGSKVSEMFTSFALQIPESLSPAAAHLHAQGESEFLRSLLVNGTRFSVMVATPMYLICAFYMEEILRILTGANQYHEEMFWIGQVLLFWSYTTILTQSVTKRIFMMSGHEKQLMWLGVGEALLNLGLSVVLIMIYRNVLCVALGSLIATFVFGWFLIWPWAAREANVSAWSLARTVLMPTWMACLPLLALLIIERHFTLPYVHGNLYALAGEVLSVSFLAALCLWYVALKPEERARLIASIGKRFKSSAA